MMVQCTYYKKCAWHSCLHRTPHTKALACRLLLCKHTGRRLKCKKVPRLKYELIKEK